MLDGHPFSALIDETKSPEEQAEDTAMAFFSLAEKLEEQRTNTNDTLTFHAILDANMYLWCFTSNLVEKQFWQETPDEAKKLLTRISTFMTNAAVNLKKQHNDELLKKMVEININMCRQILGDMDDDDADKFNMRGVRTPNKSFSLTGMRLVAAPVFH